MPATLSPPVAKEVRFDQVSRRLSELYGDVFAVIVQLRSTDHYGDPETLRMRLSEVLTEAEEKATAAGAPPEDIKDATFSVVAFLDEAILSSEWAHKSTWMARPLQLDRFQRYDAGEFFFDRVQAVLQQPHRAEVLEMYYLCMALGFKGRYQIHGQETLRQLIERSHATLAKAPGITVAELAPHGSPTSRSSDTAARRVPPWMLLVAAAAIALLVYVGMSVYVSSVAGGTVDRLQALSPPVQTAP